MLRFPEELIGLLGEAAVLVAAYDPGDRLRFANAAFREAFFVAPEESPLWSELMRRNRLMGHGTVIRNPDFDAWLTSTLSRRGKIGFRAFETDLVDGRWLWMTETVRSDGWMLCVANDITSLKADERSVRQDRDLAIRAAYTDELTGVANRRFIVEQIEKLIGAPPRSDYAVGCVALCDIDHFKAVNDRFGHVIGDLMLKDFAKRMQDQLRRSDSFGRVGGEEFVLVLPGTTVAMGEMIMERLLAIARQARPIPGRPDAGYTFSAGLAEVLPHDDAEDIIRRADDALYRAKLGGRNCVRVYTPPLPPAVNG